MLKLTTLEKFQCKKVDISLVGERHHGNESTELTIKYLRKFPVLKPIFVVLKELFFLADLNDPSKVA